MFAHLDHVSRRYRIPGSLLRRGAQRRHTVLHDITLPIETGATIALVGSSGAGKTTVARCLLALDPVDEGSVSCQGRPVRPGPVRELRWFRQLVQYVPQDPASSLDPRRSVRDLVAEPLRRLGVGGNHTELVADALGQVGLDPTLAARRPGQISGGQAQRVAIARAIVTRPRLLIADEPVSGLDLPLRHQILEVLDRLHADQGTALLLVSHDLAAVVHLCQRVVVLDQGRIAEAGPTAQLFTQPEHPATRRLLAAVPRLPQPA
ncbi:MAG: ATP-binding cassette domain-containing protein [Microlunatus sp.]